MEGKTVIITGSNTGIGKEAAREIAARGAKVILACRTPEKGEEAAKEIIGSTGNEKVCFQQLDLCSFASVRKFAKEFNEKEDRLDVLINNAGLLAPDGTHLTEDGLELGWQSNHFGHFLLTMLLLPKLKASTPSRIVNVSSEAHRTASTINPKQFKGECTINSWPVYQQTKLANILFTRLLAEKLKQSGVTVNCLHPGVIKTEFWRNLTGWKKYTIGFIGVIVGPFIKSTKQGALTTIFAATDQSLEKVSGEYFADCKLSDTNKVAKNMDLATTLWQASEELTAFNTN